MPDLPDAPEQMVTVYVKQILKNFLEGTTAWRETIVSHAHAGEREHVIDGIGNAIIVNVLEACAKSRCGDSCGNNSGTRMTGMAESIFKRLCRSDWSTCCSSGTPTVFQVAEDRKLWLYPIPSQDFDIELRVALKPALVTCQVPEHIFEDHALTIARGVKAELMAMPDKKWTHLERAGKFSMEYRYEKQVARKRVETGRANATLKAITPYFA